MSNRANYIELAPQGLKILLEQEGFLRTQFEQSDTLTLSIWELVKLRVSQINECAYCLDMHSKDALKLGETWSRIVGLSAWRDMPYYSNRERTALDLAEQLTLGKTIDETNYQMAIEVFGEKALVILTFAINAINSWNRIVKVFKPEVGHYQA
ncbi:carboxymuconolactone decarboxylase family protein [Pseudoalteromonas xiamenensis]|uniref:carboxymuconolactone decarboxylase family protein n=1 Tax=Pseudoalteromonas xiamenensis TaxID=882626 RepID=UPI0035EF85EC